MTRTDMDAQDVRRRVSRRGLLVLGVALMITAAFAAPALASEGLSGYTHTETAKQETKPTSSTTAPTTPSTSTPAQETKPSTTSAPPSPSTTPASEPAPAASTSTTPSTTASQSRSSTLPFTGLDLRWVVGFGLLMLGGGASIVLVQRRQSRGRR
jgi:cytoskeletal protein RodZ